MTPAALGALAGLGVGLGVWLVVARLAARRQPSLDQRLAPYLRPAGGSRSRSARSAPTAGITPFRTLERLLAPVMADAVRLVERIGSPASDVELRLARAGRAGTLDQHRAAQVVAAAVGAAGGLAVALLLIAGRGLNPVAALTLVAGATAAGLVVHDLVLTAAITRRERRLLAELPTVAELLALAVAAGEGPLGALERVGRTVQGDLAAEIRQALADTRAGAPLATALERLADRTGLPPLARFTEGIAVAVERGTPLADVLRAQAADAREASRRALLETGGRREIAMMAPVVFLVLPVTVVFAVFPGLATLRIDL